MYSKINAMKFCSALALAALVVAPSLAHAQGDGSDPMARGGFYLGANLGSAFDGGTDKTTGTGFDTASVDAAKTLFENNSSSVGTFGLIAGYRRRLSSAPVIMGVETDINYIGNMRDRSSGTYVSTGAGAAPAGTYTFSNPDASKYYGTLRSHLGYALPRGQVYITGGLAYVGKTSGDGTVTYTPKTGSAVPLVGKGSSRSTTGSVFGGGAEFALTDNWVGRAEYLYINIDSKNRTFTSPAGATYSVNQDSSGHFSVLRLGFTYAF